jgi:hypothetical protein
VIHKVRLRSRNLCCICHEWSVQVHHILPTADGGPDDIENAAPLCPNCHDKYGGNPSKRQQIREVRDRWYKEVENKYGSMQETVCQLSVRLTAVESSLAGSSPVELEPVGVLSFSASLGESAGGNQSLVKDISHIAFGGDLLGEARSLFVATASVFGGGYSSGYIVPDDDNETTFLLYRDSGALAACMEALVAGCRETRPQNVALSF